MKSTHVAGLLLSLLLTACVTPEEMAQRRAQEETQRQARIQAELAAQQARKRAELAAMRSRCLSYGYRENSDALANCVQAEIHVAQRNAQEQLEQERRERERRERLESERLERERRDRERLPPPPGPQKPYGQSHEYGCKLFEHINLAGNVYSMPPDSQHSVLRDFNDRASSVWVSRGCVLTVYEHHQFKGSSVSFSEGPANVQLLWNDRISSAQCACR